MCTDVRERRIPNSICVALLIAGVIFRLATGGLVGLSECGAGFAVGFGIMFLLYAFGSGGAGDVKFLAAVGSWLGPYHVFMVFILSAILLLLFSIALATTNVIARSFKASSVYKASDGIDSTAKSHIPYAVPITVAIFLRMIWMLWIGRTS